MITADFSNIKVAGISVAVPTKCVQAHEYDEVFGEQVVSKNIAVTGVKQTYHASDKQTVSDLAYVAAKNLMKELKVDPSSIGLLIFISPYLDYVIPPTACVLQSRLGLSADCVVFDMDLACSGYVYGLATVFSILQSSSAKSALLLVGDMASKTLSPLDKTRLLFGDAGSATLIEKTEDCNQTHFAMKTDGTRFKSIIMPAGAFRNPQASSERVEWADGNIRSDYDLFMNGTDVFSFSITDVPRLAIEFMHRYDYSSDDFDAFILHQANLFILKHLIVKIGAPIDKMPISLNRYGNTGICSIPLTICDKYHSDSGKKRLFIYGFGVGLSWACASVIVDADCVYPIKNSDEYFTEGIVPHY